MAERPAGPRAIVTTPSVTAIGAAMGWELSCVRRKLTGASRLPTRDVAAWRCRAGGAEVVVYRTGMGPDAATRSTRALLGQVDVDALVNTGCAGGLSADCLPASVVVPARVIGPLPAGGSYPVDELLRARWVGVARAAGLIPLAGALCTNPSVLYSPAEKRACGLRWDAVAVDMEAAAVASVARDAGIPFAAIRVVLDSLDHSIPNLGDRGGESGPVRRLLRSGVDPRALALLAVHFFRARRVLRQVFASLPLDGASSSK